MTRRPFSIYRVSVFLVVLSIGAIAAIAAGNVGSQDTEAQGTSGDFALLVVYVLLALVFSFLCSVAEAVLLSITPSFIAGLEEHKPKRAARLKRLKQEKVDQSLAAILTLNTIAHTVGAIGSGSKATLVFGSAWFGVFSAVMTLMILFLSEIIPKTLGAVYWRHLTAPVAFFVQGLILSLYPLIWMSEGLTRLISRKDDAHIISREELVAMAGLGETAGEINESESRIINNLFKLGSLEAADIMTPRTVIAAFPQDITVAKALESEQHMPFSRLPVFGKDIDDIRGFILKDELLLSKARGQGEVRLEELRRDIPVVNGELKLSGLLDLLLDNRQHIALVSDIYGGTKGLVTLEDVVETLLGLEIVDELDKVEDMRALARKRWEKRAKRLGVDLKFPAKDDPDAGDSSDPNQKSD